MEATKRAAAVIAAAALFVTWAGSPVANAATARSRAIGPQTSFTIPLQPHVRLAIPRHSVDRWGRITVLFLAHHAFSVRISVPWRRRIAIVARVNGRTHSELLGGFLFTRSGPKGKASAAKPAANAAFSLNPLGNICVKIGIAVGTAALETGPFDPEISGSAVVTCLLHLGVDHLRGDLLAKIATALGHDCVAALVKSKINDVTFFNVPQCNEPKGPSGPSDGTPLVVATLSIPTLTGIPIGSSPAAPPSNPSPTPTPPPPPPPPPPPSPSISASKGGHYGCSNCYALNVQVHNFPTGTYTYYCIDNGGSGGSDTVFFSHAVAVTDPNQSTWPGVFCDDNSPYSAYVVIDGVASNRVQF